MKKILQERDNLISLSYSQWELTNMVIWGEDFPSWGLWILIAPLNSISWENSDLEKKKVAEFNITKYLMYEISKNNTQIKYY